jgi:hypothetical protein
MPGWRWLTFQPEQGRNVAENAWHKWRRPTAAYGWPINSVVQPDVGHRWFTRGLAIIHVGKLSRLISVQTCAAN